MSTTVGDVMTTRVIARRGIQDDRSIAAVKIIVAEEFGMLAVSQPVD
jgi:hypothetical protein